MKKSFSYSVLICLPFIFASCKKPNNDTNSTDYYMSAKVGGEQKTYKINPVAVKLQLDTVYAIGLTAYGNVTTGEYFFLDVTTNKPIVTDTYIDAGANDLVVIGGYNPGTTDGTKVYGAGLQTDNNPPLQITISILTATNVSGTFSGTYYNNGGDGPGIIAVTEGKFNLPLH
jgi:hypothetical protein